jgi:peroxiredoxin
VHTGHLAAAALLIGATAAGCARSEAGRAPPSPSSSVAQGGRGASAWLLPGAQAPNVSFKLQDDFDLQLASLRGKVVVVYFCGDHREAACISEARSIRERWATLEVLHVAVVGVTDEDAATRRDVIARERLPFDLARDTNGSLAASFGVAPLSVGSWRGFLIGRDGVVHAAWSSSEPDVHVARLLALAR